MLLSEKSSKSDEERVKLNKLFNGFEWRPEVRSLQIHTERLEEAQSELLQQLRQVGEPLKTAETREDSARNGHVWLVFDVSKPF